MVFLFTEIVYPAIRQLDDELLAQGLDHNINLYQSQSNEEESIYSKIIIFSYTFIPALLLSAAISFKKLQFLPLMVVSVICGLMNVYLWLLMLIQVTGSWNSSVMSSWINQIVTIPWRLMSFKTRHDGERKQSSFEDLARSDYSSDTSSLYTSPISSPNKSPEMSLRRKRSITEEIDSSAAMSDHQAYPTSPKRSHNASPVLGTSSWSASPHSSPENNKTKGIRSLSSHSRDGLDPSAPDRDRSESIGLTIDIDGHFDGHNDQSIYYPSPASLPVSPNKRSQYPI